MFFWFGRVGQGRSWCWRRMVTDYLSWRWAVPRVQALPIEAASYLKSYRTRCAGTGWDQLIGSAMSELREWLHSCECYFWWARPGWTAWTLWLHIRTNCWWRFRRRIAAAITGGCYLGYTPASEDVDAYFRSNRYSIGQEEVLADM